MESCIVVGSAVESKLLDKEREDMDPSRAQMHFLLDRERMRREVEGKRPGSIRTGEAVVLSSKQKSPDRSISIIRIAIMFANLVRRIAFGKLGKSKQQYVRASRGFLSDEGEINERA
jgi:hypothetical protein